MFTNFCSECNTVMESNAMGWLFCPKCETFTNCSQSLTIDFVPQNNNKEEQKNTSVSVKPKSIYDLRETPYDVKKGILPKTKDTKVNQNFKQEINKAKTEVIQTNKQEKKNKVEDDIPIFETLKPFPAEHLCRNCGYKMASLELTLQTKTYTCGKCNTKIVLKRTSRTQILADKIKANPVRGICKALEYVFEANCFLSCKKNACISGFCHTHYHRQYRWWKKTGENNLENNSSEASFLNLSFGLEKEKFQTIDVTNTPIFEEIPSPFDDNNDDKPEPELEKVENAIIKTPVENKDLSTGAKISAFMKMYVESQKQHLDQMAMFFDQLTDE